jgi:subtilisin-like proprotein convertase family protein
MFKNVSFALLLVLAAMGARAQDAAPAFWQDVPDNAFDVATGPRYIIPTRYRAIRLDLSVLQNNLRGTTADNAQSVTLVLPLPDGTTGRFELRETPVMAPDLQEKHPEIRCYSGQGIDDPSASIKADLTPQGFHAMIRSARMGSIFIDPYYHGADITAGIVYFKKDYQRTKNDHFACLTEPGDVLNATELGTSHEHEGTTASADFAGDCRLRRYRLALACTGEYATFHGGTKPLVLAAMNTSINRVNEVYEIDLAVTLQLIANNDTLIFLNANTDPYTNDDGGAMLDQNQTTVTQRIGAANYDIGHVFSTGGGGVAGLGVVCNNSSKAVGVTGLGSPIGDPFDIDYVAHEIGHQFGGNHCFNNSCGGNINSSTAMEPGSGSTIMAYAGICSPNVQNNSDPYFHAVNIQEMSAFINNGTGNNCPVKITTGNNAPTVANFPNFNIPRSTPFALTAQANDVDGDTLTYCWEQMNQQSATMPPVGTSTGGPLFRSYNPTTSATRTFPRLPDLVANVNSTWEELPSVARTMNFRVVVRDNNAGAGCTAEDDVTLTVSGTAGPFLVTVPNTTGIVWNVGENQNVTWDVANTTAAPISCSTVRILLSTDGGFTYPIVLADNVPNSGSASVSVPNNVSTTCRVRVEAVGNVFFDISNQNFRIQLPPSPTFVLASNATSQIVCAGESTSFDLAVTSLAGFNSSVDVVVSGAPAGAAVAITPGSITPTGTISIAISDLTPAMAGNYALTVTATGGTITQTLNLNLTVLPGAPTGAANPSLPANGATGVSLLPSLTWQSVPFAQAYSVQVATSPSFEPSSIVATLASSTLSGTVPTTLQLATPYYWRVRAENDCDQTAWSVTYSFQTGNQNCNQTFGSTDVPIGIDVNGVTLIESDLQVPNNSFLTDVNVSIDVDHTWVGDLLARLQGPNGTIVQLFDRPGSPESPDGCDGNNLLVTFDDEATQSAENFENTCGNNPAISGTYRAIESLSAYDGISAQGAWKLIIDDAYPEFDAGSLEGWSLTFCFGVQVGVGQLLTNQPLTLPTGASADVTPTNLQSQASGTAAQVRYTLLSLPQHGFLQKNGVTLSVGGTFSQQDIADGTVTYVHSGNAATTDAFQFDVLDQNNAAWISSATFDIIILQNTLAATAAVTQQVACAGGATGQITVTTTGGSTPFSYSINGDTGQADNVFAGLTAGAYTVVVTDGFGFSVTAGTLTLSAPPAISVAYSVDQDDLTVAATGGTGALEYSIDGTNFQVSNVFPSLADGIYTVTVRDENGCTQTAQALVTVSTLLATATQATPILCFGGGTGSITVQAAGGFSPYEYSLNGIDFQTNSTFSGLSAGTYSVDIRDANGTLTTTSDITLGQPSALNLSLESTFYQLEVTAQGGTPPYAYSLDGGPAQTDNVFSNLPNGDYLVVVTDANGCTQSILSTIEVPALAIVAVDVSGTPDCGGVIASVSVNATGGQPPYEYRLNGGAWQSSNVFLNVGAGQVVFDVRDAAGAIVSSNPLVITQPAPIVATVGIIGNDATVQASGGTGAYSYNIGGQVQPNGSYNNLPAGQYTCTITDANGCTATISFSITYTNPVLALAVQNVSCNGLSNGSISVAVTGGQAPYTFQSSVLTNLPAGVYTITVTDALGTTVTDSATVAEPEVLNLTATASPNGTVVCTATGGTAPYVYSLNGLVFQNSPTFAALATGDYTFTVRDANGCVTTLDLTVVGTVEPQSAWGLSVSPNPSAGLFTVSLERVPGGTLLLDVYDVAGRLVQQRSFEVTGSVWQTQLDLQALPQGSYWLTLTTAEGVGAARLSVVRGE